MSQKNVYNHITDAEEVDKSNAPESSGQSSETASTKTPNAQDTTGLNVKPASEKDAKKFEFKNLQGELVLTPTEKSFSIVRGSTIHLSGVGKYLSGLYFVTARTVSINNSGAMSIKLRVVRTKFGDSLKGEKPLPEIQTIDTMGSSEGSSEGSSGSGSYSSGDSPYEDYPYEDSQTYPDGNPVGGGNADSGEEERVPISYQV